MSPIIQLISLSLVLLTGATSLPAQGGQIDAGTRAAIRNSGCNSLLSASP